ncbi:MAG: hypothetical protein HOE11_04490 [Candidatus Diapherotrites archaeon]|jgi:hypothetical protein|nr:hypothetical protein [Candidatus Diapherotrites archaeon]MBT4596442.1 hypothetical protein [Candidatus Diapherotrites archaeon]
MKKIIIPILLVLVILAVASGCVSLVPNQATLQEFQSVKAKYAPVAFPTTTGMLGDYISELSYLRTRSSLSVASVVDAELNAVQAFYYYNLAINEFTTLNFSSCDTKTVNQAKSFVVLTAKYSDLATAAYNLTSSSERAYLNPNQAELNEYMLMSAENINVEIQDNC